MKDTTKEKIEKLVKLIRKYGSSANEVEEFIIEQRKLEEDKEFEDMAVSAIFLANRIPGGGKQSDGE